MYDGLCHCRRHEALHRLRCEQGAAFCSGAWGGSPCGPAAADEANAYGEQGPRNGNGIGIAPPLLVIGPPALGHFLHELSRLTALRYRFLSCADMNAPQSGLRSEVLMRAHLRKLCSVPVQHCSYAYAVVLEGVRGWKIVYSGDTRPCEALVRAGRDATLLLHEATFEEGREEDARRKNHSTTAEAVDIGERMGAYRILLTHFSQRYGKAPVWDRSLCRPRVCPAFDSMCLNLSEIPRLPQHNAAMRRLLEVVEKGEGDGEEPYEDAPEPEQGHQDGDLDGWYPG